MWWNSCRATRRRSRGFWKSRTAGCGSSLPNRRETALQTARILPWPGPAYDKNCSRDAALDILERHKGRRDVANVDPLELWELAQGEVDQAPAEWFAELALSEPDMDAVAACGHALLQAKSHFKFNPPNFEVYPESVVAARLAEQEAARKREEACGQGQRLHPPALGHPSEKEQGLP
ncbi:MAG: hypothetical protein V8Q84_09620 [Bilophila sp.]